MRKNILILWCILMTGCVTVAHRSTLIQSPLRGFWAFRDEIREYHGLYVYEFDASGKIFQYNYRPGWEPGHRVKVLHAGWWEERGDIVTLRFGVERRPKQYRLTDDNILQPITDPEERPHRLAPVHFVDGIPQIPREHGGEQAPGARGP